MTSSVLPDPTEDLHWGSWDKAIHEVFDANARRFPGRNCVVETAPWREFTYGTINEASNILAHHLVNAGIQRGEVVMLYSYRGVDLVVAIMGVLKAGATFSVIDPLYPPARQIIYLDVAKPRALVVIKKATEHAGGFAPEVTDWITENLELRTTVPELVLLDDGELKGGAVMTGQDALADAQALKVKLPGVVVGPDSTPTLSFTSGSEGRPKGVRGRHFSLLHYFPWMAQRFGLSEKDRFTMLSGIAHDPIQRDIFTPLFLGAQLYVPSAEDIQHDRLASWMKKYETTVTHLTPAMGQILVGGERPDHFPSLRNAFFVGDVLIKRDVRRLQELAENTTVINMFGTTETQRAVSYFAVRPRSDGSNHLDTLPDVIPAGKGMQGVQLLVIDRENTSRQCDIGEQGEIYVRAAGLAEGYLGLEDTNREKFVMNTFFDNSKWIEQDKQAVAAQEEQTEWRKYYFGPRDRMYRSGDLGRYTDSGDVVCTGRVDNQVKIRGFRFELGDLDSNLSAHPLVRENVTLYRRDQNEEGQLFSFVVPNIAGWKDWLQSRGFSDDSNDTSITGMLQRFEPLRQALRDYLKTKVPIYAVPSLIIPISKIPLNPNGKPDRPILLAMLTDLPQRVPTTANLNATELAVAESWGDVLEGVPANTISPDDSWLDLGGNSIKANSMVRLVRQKFPKVKLQDIYQYPTLADFSKSIEAAGDGKMTTEDYAGDAAKLAKELPSHFPTAKASSQPATVLLTGATGFLGAFILHNLLSRSYVNKVYTLIRGSQDTLMTRLHRTLTAYGLWSPSFAARLHPLSGDLEKPHFGLDKEVWNTLATSVDLIIHNGARVDWLLTYRHLKPSNVLSTLSACHLAAEGDHAKRVVFVSSTAVLDTEHYINVSKSEGGIAEADNLSGSAQGLTSGYGQTKWASEYLMRVAGQRGLSGAVVRAGYVLGDSKTGASVTDDFLIRMLKGCVQLGAYPEVKNTINMVPVDHVARIVVAAGIHACGDDSQTKSIVTVQVTPNPRLSWQQFLSTLESYYDVKAESYETWRTRLIKYVEQGEGEEFSALPLLDMLTGDFISATTERLLKNGNAVAALEMDGISPKEGASVTSENVALYLGYLKQIGFMPSEKSAKALPQVNIGEDQMMALKGLSGRGAVVKP
jgi:L-aminoadipate-semialdehyde dehydrogenase